MADLGAGAVKVAALALTTPPASTPSMSSAEVAIMVLKRGASCVQEV